MKVHGAALWKAFSLVAALGLSPFSCYLPVYDPATSLSAGFERKLEKVNRIGPAKVSDSDAYEGYFVPHRTAVPSDGYWIMSRPSYFRARYLYSTANGAILSSQAYSNGSTILGARALVAALTDAEASSSAGGGIFVAMDSQGGMGMARLQFTSIGGISSAAWSSNTACFSSGGSLIGAGCYQDVSNDYYSFLFSGYDASSNYRLGEYYALKPQGSPLGSDMVTPALITYYSGPKLQPGAFFATEDGSSYYLSGKSAADGSVYTARYSSLGIAPTLLSGVTRQLSALLSNGNLLARDDLTTILYDAGGSKIATLRTGSLRFVHEYYDMAGSTWYSYFTRPVGDRSSSGSDLELYVDVYRVPTAGLASLAD
jgi:hypothetical protein